MCHPCCVLAQEVGSEAQVDVRAQGLTGDVWPSTSSVGGMLMCPLSVIPIHAREGGTGGGHPCRVICHSWGHAVPLLVTASLSLVLGCDACSFPEQEVFVNRPPTTLPWVVRATYPNIWQPLSSPFQKDSTKTRCGRQGRDRRSGVWGEVRNSRIEAVKKREWEGRTQTLPLLPGYPGPEDQAQSSCPVLASSNSSSPLVTIAGLPSSLPQPSPTCKFEGDHNPEAPGEGLL